MPSQRPTALERRNSQIPPRPPTLERRESMPTWPASLQRKSSSAGILTRTFPLERRGSSLLLRPASPERSTSAWTAARTSFEFGSRAAPHQPGGYMPQAGSSAGHPGMPEPGAPRCGWSQLLTASIAAHAPADGNVSLANAVSKWWDDAESHSLVRKPRGRVPLHILLDESIGGWADSKA